MGIFRNEPRMQGNDGEQKIKRYVHSKLTVDHNGIQCTIHENGRVTLAKVVGRVKDSDGKETDDVEYDEIEVPASLIFKMVSLLKATRQTKYVSLAELREGKAVGTDAREHLEA